MKADWDDAPHRLKTSRGAAEISKWLIAGLIGISSGVGLLYLTGTPIPFLQDATSTAQIEQPQAQSPYLPPIDNPSASQPTAEEMFWSNINERDQEQKARTKQTDYNDQNYTPRLPDNVVSMEGVRQSSAYQQPVQQKATSRKTVEKETHGIPKWDGGGYIASWTVVDNYIDGGTVCGNYKRGSIDYRECRKGAKQFFKNECRAWGERWENHREPRNDRMKQRYCSAANSFSPMG